MTDVLKPLYAVAALLGVYVLRPLYQLLVDTSTFYSRILTALEKLNNELTTMVPLRMFSKHQVFTFVNGYTFKKSWPSVNLLDNLTQI